MLQFWEDVLSSLNVLEISMEGEGHIRHDGGCVQCDNQTRTEYRLIQMDYYLPKGTKINPVCMGHGKGDQH